MRPLGSGGGFGSNLGGPGSSVLGELELNQTSGRFRGLASCSVVRALTALGGLVGREGVPASHDRKRPRADGLTTLDRDRTRGLAGDMEPGVSVAPE